MLTCYRSRRNIGAFLDDALAGPVRERIAAHLAACGRCQREADALRRLRSLLRASLPPSDPDWSGLWPAIVRGIADGRRLAPLPARTSWVRPTWALGGALAAALLVSVTIWQFAPGPMSADPPVVVRSADTGHPGGTVMVYSVPEQDVTVVWVFGDD